MPDPLFNAPILRLPQGLLGFLELKNGGAFPQRLASEALIPSLDLTDWYLGSNADISSAAPFAVTTTGFFGTGGISVNLQWTELLTATTDALVATEQIRMCVAYRNIVSGVARHMALGPTEGSAVVGDRVVASMYARNTIIPPGSELGVWVQNFGAGSISVTIQVRQQTLAQ